jgi:hypothetical protein
MVKENLEKAKAGKIGVSFFDALKPGNTIHLKNAQLTITASSKHCVKKVQSERDGQQYISLTNDELEKLTELTSERDQDRGVVAELSLTGQQEIGCTRYIGTSVLFTLKESSTEGCCIPMPLQQVEEACRVRFTAADSGGADFIENAKSFLNSVQWTMTAVPGINTAHGSARPFQAFTASVMSVEGNAEIAEIPLHQLYRLETRGPEGYTSDGPSVEYMYVCCDTFIAKKSSFCACGSKPTRSLVFVQEKCQGKRWKGGNVSLGGQPVKIDENGIMHVPLDMDGLVPISCPGMTLSPSIIDLRKDAQPVMTITVSDQPGLTAGVNVRGQFVDDKNMPFVRRPISVLLPNGEEVQVLTDEQGFFEAPKGSSVRAREDNWGAATESVYLTETI